MLNEKDKENLKRNLKELADSENELRPKPQEEKSPYRFMYLGFEFAFTIGFCVYLGRYFDTKWQTTPLLLLLGLAIGFATALYRLITVANEINSE